MSLDAWPAVVPVEDVLEDAVLDPPDESVDWSCSREAIRSLDSVGEAAEPVDAVVAAETDAEDVDWLDVPDEVAPAIWVAAAADACRIAAMRFCCWLAEDTELIDMVHS